MQVVVINSQKGGSGKTMLAKHLAVEAERAGDGPVFLIDTDPQGSLTPGTPSGSRRFRSELRSLLKAYIRVWTFCVGMVRRTASSPPLQVGSTSPRISSSWPTL